MLNHGGIRSRSPRSAHAGSEPGGFLQVSDAADDGLIADGIGSARRVAVHHGACGLDLPDRFGIVKIKTAGLEPGD